MGMGFGYLGLHKLANNCFQLALRIANDTDNQLCIANCHVVYANYLVSKGCADTAIENFLVARRLYLRAGDLGRATTTVRGLVAFYRELGDPRYRDLNQETNDVTKYAGDIHNISFVHMTNGRIAIWDGDYQGAVRQFDAAINNYLATGNVSSHASALCELTRSHILLGNYAQAEKCVAEIDKIDFSLLRGSLATWSIMGKAQVLLMLAEDGPVHRRAHYLASAGTACKLATRYARRTKDYGCVESLRLEANLSWLLGKRDKANSLWNRALLESEHKGYKPVAADIHLDLGQRLGQRDNLRKAQALWAEIGSPAKVAMIEDLLSRLQ
jgi:tetratricopeptide (TPR) repeat protein